MLFISNLAMLAEQDQGLESSLYATKSLATISSVGEHEADNHHLFEVRAPYHLLAMDYLNRKAGHFRAPCSPCPPHLSLKGPPSLF